MSLRRVSILIVVTLSLGSTLAFTSPNFELLQANAQNTEGQRRPGRNKNSLVRELKLTSEQQQQMQTIQNQYQEQIRGRQQALRQARQELMTLMAGTASENQIREKYRQVATLQQEVSDIRFNSFVAMREVLTPEQRRQFAQRMQNRRWERTPKREMNRDQEQS